MRWEGRAPSRTQDRGNVANVANIQLIIEIGYRIAARKTSGASAKFTAEPPDDWKQLV